MPVVQAEAFAATPIKSPRAWFGLRKPGVTYAKALDSSYQVRHGALSACWSVRLICTAMPVALSMCTFTRAWVLRVSLQNKAHVVILAEDQSTGADMIGTTVTDTPTNTNPYPPPIDMQSSAFSVYAPSEPASDSSGFQTPVAQVFALNELSHSLSQSLSQSLPSPLRRALSGLWVSLSPSKAKDTQEETETQDGLGSQETSVQKEEQTCGEDVLAQETPARESTVQQEQASGEIVPAQGEDQNAHESEVRSTCACKAGQSSQRSEALSALMHMRANPALCSMVQCTCVCMRLCCAAQADEPPIEASYGFDFQALSAPTHTHPTPKLTALSSFQRMIRGLTGSPLPNNALATHQGPSVEITPSQGAPGQGVPPSACPEETLVAKRGPPPGFPAKPTPAMQGPPPAQAEDANVAKRGPPPGFPDKPAATVQSQAPAVQAEAPSAAHGPAPAAPPQQQGAAKRGPPPGFVQYKVSMCLCVCVCVCAYTARVSDNEAQHCVHGCYPARWWIDEFQQPHIRVCVCVYAHVPVGDRVSTDCLQPGQRVPPCL